MGSSLPMFVVLKSKYNNKYLEYVKEEGEAKGYVRFSGEDVHSPLSKFEVERADIDDSKLVHLRCCYNNKYLMASIETDHWIVSQADKPENDQSEQHGTLFEPIPSAGHPDDYRFKHVKIGHYAVPMEEAAGSPLNNCLFAAWADPRSDLSDVFTVIDWKSLVVLPRHVAFKGDNGNYLSAYLKWGCNYLQFGASDVGHPTVAQEVFPNPDGSIRFKSTYFGQFWKRSPNWIRADSDDTSTNNKDTLFWPVKLGHNTIALRSLGNDRFCKRLTTDGIDDCLNADDTISKYSILQVTELVLSREIYNVQFHLSRARRYNEHVVAMGSGVATNTTNREDTMDVKVSHRETTTKSWKASVSFKLGVKTTLETKIPLVFEGKIEVSAELATGYQWGQDRTEENSVEVTCKAPVPPMTMVTVSAVGSVATCDVPFSYTQTDTLMDGTRRTYDMDDGLYRGSNSFNVSYEIKQKNISPLE